MLVTSITTFLQNNIKEALDKMLSGDELNTVLINFNHGRYIRFLGSKTRGILFGIPIFSLTSLDTIAVKKLAEELDIPLVEKPDSLVTGLPCSEYRKQLTSDTVAAAAFRALTEKPDSLVTGSPCLEYQKQLASDTEAAAAIAIRVLNALVADHILIQNVGCAPAVPTTDEQITMDSAMLSDDFRNFQNSHGLTITLGLLMTLVAQRSKDIPMSKLIEALGLAIKQTEEASND